jgi:DNA helicase-2/ATP-dependent DNA helicase PcrA
MEFEKAYKQLNAAQKQAVDAIDGPVLVIAGPGTGKTQLLSARVAQILKQTDTLPQNILCLTFTESGAQNMRDRLTRFIGQAAYDVQISTYHAFGGDLIQRYGEYFTDIRLENPVDELGKRQILSDIINNLPYSNPLKQTRHHLGDLMATISEVKRGLLTSESLRSLASANLTTITTLSPQISDILNDIVRFPTKLATAAPLFEELQAVFDTASGPKPVLEPLQSFSDLADLAGQALATARELAAEQGKTTPLTKWKNDWLAKDENNKFVLDGKLAAERMIALADVLERYASALNARGLYDFDDMILESIKVLQRVPELKYSLQERYQYLLLDEFQDTNAAQLQLVELLTDNPANEGRPNVLAVGDDDQAIYAFQGAQYSNMLDFYRLYREPTVVNLTENYRSDAAILSAAEQVSGQIAERLEQQFPNLDKTLVAAREIDAKPVLERREFLSDVAQHAWVAASIADLIKQGIDPSEIAVLAPKHRFLEPLVSYLRQRDVPVRYEKRENILEAPVVRQLITMSQLVLALSARDDRLADTLWPIVLSYDFWALPTSEIWKLSWQAADDKTSWSRLLLESEQFKLPALLFLSLADQAATETLETMLDRLIGSDVVTSHEADTPLLRSPLRDFYLTTAGPTSDLLYSTLTELTVLRSKLRDHQTSQNQTLQLRDLLDFVAAYEAANERMLNTSPYADAAEAVQLMTVFKAKGLEFTHVFLVACQDDVWGSSSRGMSNKLTLPANLAPIRHAGATDDERLRLLFVAMTRAKHGLHLTSYNRTYSGKATRRLKYFNEIEQADGSFVITILPEPYQAVIADDSQPPALAEIEDNWQQRHLKQDHQLRSLLCDRLEQYQLSPTHLTSFLDLEHAGPQAFYFNVLLRFPTAPTASSAFGTAVHESLEWLQQQLNQTDTLPTAAELIDYFTTCLARCRLSSGQHALELERGSKALTQYLAKHGSSFRKGDRPEHNFRNEGVFLDDIHLGGKIDKLEIDTKNKTITVVDYKTGKSFDRWNNEPKPRRFKLQLYCYKLLIEGSHTYKGYSVKTGRLEFVEPDSSGKIQTLELTFDDAELARTKQLLAVFWEHVQELNIPDVSAYPTTATGMAAFETDLLDGTI